MINKKNTMGMLAIALLFGVSCTPTNSYTVTGTLSDTSADGNVVYLMDYHTNKYVDSTLVSGNTFTFKGTILTDSIRRIDISKTNYYANFILEPGEIKIELTNKNEYQSSGTLKNDLFAQIENINKENYNTFLAIREKLAKDSTLTQNQLSEQTIQASDSLRAVYMASIEMYATQNPNTSISIYAIWNMLMLDGKSDYFETIKSLTEKDSHAAGFQPIKNMLKKGEQVLIASEGKPYLDFTAENGKPEGGKASLSDYVGKGKYILVDFWASWCGPCKAEMPNIKNIYNKYKGKDFDVLSVAVWEDREASLKGIQEHGMTWSQIVGAPTTATDLYGINGIPHIILFGPDGTILKRGLRGENMEQIIKEILEKK